jgi:uncharacterized protein (DUF4415 family)
MPAGSSRRAERASKSGERITRYTLEELEKLGPGETDWARIDALTDDEIEAAMRADPDWADLVDVDWSDAVLVVPTKKKAISIRLDEDVIEYFKAQGEGYQTRMNAVLRHFMEKTKRPDAAE